MFLHIAPVISSPGDQSTVNKNENEPGAVDGTLLFAVTTDTPASDVVTIAISPANSDIFYDSTNKQVELVEAATFDTETVPSYTIVVT